MVDTVLTPNKTKEALRICIKARRPVMVRGPVGIGKSAIVRQLAKEMNRQLIDIRLSMRDPVDLMGMPMVDTKKAITSWARPGSFPANDGSEGIIFLDEINLAPPLVQAAAYQLIHDRQLGDYKLPDGWDIIAAGNRDQDGCGVTPMKAALAARFCHLEMKEDLQDTLQWMVTDEDANIHSAVVAFLRWRGELFSKFDPKQLVSPNPRAWQFISDLTNQSPPQELHLPLFSGHVGHGAGVEYTSFLPIYFNLPNIDEIMLNPAGARLPAATKPAEAYAVASALGRRIDKQNIARALTYLERLSKEYCVLAINDAQKRDRTICDTATFTKWSINNAALVGAA